jgi:uncharacterized membrane protein YphA (DoxX/SURF4 family)
MTHPVKARLFASCDAYRSPLCVVRRLFVGDPPLFASRPFYQYSTFAIVTLVLLRLAVGWHFFKEGADKIHDKKFSSVGFLSAAKGPLAPTFHGMIWDADGYHRIDIERDDQGDIARNAKGEPLVAGYTLPEWQAFRDEAGQQYGFDDKQTKQATAIYNRYERMLVSYLRSIADGDGGEYFKKLQRRDRYKGHPQDSDPKKDEVTGAWTQVPALRGQLASLETDIKKQRGPWLASIDAMWNGYEQEINNLATEDQQSRGPVRLVRPGRTLTDNITIDRFIPYFDLTIGILLVLGLFTRVAASAGAAFLATIVITQWPWAYDVQPTFNQTVELCALLVLAGTAAGRFAGLDWFLHAACLKCCPPKQETKNATNA